MSTTSSTIQEQISRPVRQWKPNAPQRKPNSTPKRKDFSTVNSNPETGVSLCVPFAFKNVGPKRVFSTFKKVTFVHPKTGEIRKNVSLGFIERIDIKFRKDGNKCIFIHFAPRRWNDANSDILEAMKSGQHLKVMTDENGHFWKTIISKSQRPADYFEDEEESVEDDSKKESEKSLSYDRENTDGQAVEQNDNFA
jgi:hypothetical protein